ncbi:autotransporter assembly complex protein TamA [Acuticoccus sp.]|uniref:autotransporter assembly complex protein TamA n=1 Tax=Acuticoccus sp. TaxID=1904378 RepID=UPI003B51AF3B
MSQLVRYACVALVTLLALPAPALAIEIFGYRFFEDEPEVPEGGVAYTVEFEVFGDDRGLTRRIERASALEEESDEPSPGAGALIARAQSDYQRILAALYADGRYGPTISILVDGREAATLPIDTTLGEAAEVYVTVDPGPVYAFADVDIANRPGEVPDDDDVPKTVEELGLRPGEPALSGVVLASEAALVGRWRELGYPKAAIADRDATARHDDDALDVGIAVEPGRPAVFGTTTVSGTTRMDPGFVAYYAGIEPGEPFDPDDLERARDQLRRLEVFRAIRIVEADAIGPDGTLDVDLQLAERPPRVFGAGVKFSSLDGIGGEAYWRHRNLFGRAEKLDLRASVGGINGEDPDLYNYRVAATFIKPGVFTPYTDFTALLFAEQLAPDTFRARTVGARAGLTNRVTERLTVSAFGSVEVSTIDETEVGDGDFVFLSLPVTVEYDGSNDRYDPTRGYRASLRLEPFYEAVNSNVGGITEVEGSVYYGLADDRLVLAARGAVGSIFGTPYDETPATKLFHIGGGGSIRGYPYKGVGPRDDDDDVVGGRSYLEGSLEARIRVTDKIGVVPFVDVGNAFEDELPDFSEPLKVGVGLGLRYRTGLGPLRADVAFPLDPFDGDPAVAFYLGLGQAF